MKTNTESTHMEITSGLQWFMHGPDLLTPFFREVIMSQHGEVCRCAGPVDIQKANAALIVRAVNSHAELVALVRNFEAHCSHSLLDLSQGNAGMVSDVKTARALLARLEK